MNHKRGRAKNQRSGCLMCKPWKVNGASPRQGLKASEARRIQDSEQPLGHPMFGDFECDDYVYDVRAQAMFDNDDFEGWWDHLCGGTLNAPLIEVARLR